tara:strand:- start:24725 stop:26194 length:1470 start_codon:yes stop_codon:yes gene_type:complete
MKTKIALYLAILMTSNYAHAEKFSVIIDKEQNSYVTPEWFTYYEYTDWIDSGYPYDCIEEFRYEGIEVFRKETCNQDQARTYDEYLKEKYTGELKLVSSDGEETRTIVVVEESEVGSATITADTFQIEEGDSGTNPTITLKVSLNKALDFPVMYSYNTQDVTTSSILDKAENLVYDEYGNPFISVVDNAGGGKLIFDGGFPKYYNTNWDISPKDSFQNLHPQFKFMHNILEWIGDTHKSRGKILLYGDRVVGNTYYHVKETGTYGFAKSIPSTISMAGFTPVVKDYQDYGGVYCDANNMANISLDEMNNYAAIIIMASGYCDSLSETSVNNFTTYVNNGGGVYIITDHNSFQPTGNQILRKFGSEFYGMVNRTSTHDAYKLSTIWSNLSETEYNQSHPLWKGFTSTDSIPAGGSEGNVRLFTPQTDIVAQSGTLLFNAGEIEKEVTLTINGDNIKEENEVFRFIIQSGNNTGHVDPDSEGKEITILDDD